MIATVLTTLCRKEAHPSPPSRFSRHFSRQSVVSAKAPSRPIPTKSRQKCRDSGAAARAHGEPRQISRHFSGIAEDRRPAFGILPFILPKWQDAAIRTKIRTSCPDKSDHPGYSFERTPWVLVTGVEPLNFQDSRRTGAQLLPPWVDEIEFLSTAFA